MELMEKEVEDEICTCHVHGMDFDFLEALITKLWKLSGRSIQNLQVQRVTGKYQLTVGRWER